MEIGIITYKREQQQCAAKNIKREDDLTAVYVKPPELDALADACAAQHACVSARISTTRCLNQKYKC